LKEGKNRKKKLSLSFGLSLSQRFEKKGTQRNCFVIVVVDDDVDGIGGDEAEEKSKRKENEKGFRLSPLSRSLAPAPSLPFFF
jgi:hypothetical protein